MVDYGRLTTEADVEALIGPMPSGYIRDFVTYCWHVTDAHVVYALGAALASASVMAPMHLQVNNEYPPVWTLLIGPSGRARKSVIMKHAQKAVEMVDPSRLAAEPESEAALVEALAREPQSLLVYGELSSLLVASRGNSYKGPVKQRLMQLWDCSYQSKEGLKRGRIVCESPRLSMMAGITPVQIEEYVDAVDMQGGFTSRFIILYAEPEREYEPPPPAWEAGRDHVAYRLREFRDRCLNRVGPAGPWTDAAVEYWRAWAAQRNASIQVTEQLAGIVERSSAVAIKVATLYALDVGAARQAADLEPDAVWHLDVDDIAFGCAVADMHLRSALTLGSRIALGPFERRCRAVLDTLRQPERSHLKLGQILKEARPRMSRRDLVAVMETLIETGEIRQVQVNGGTIYYTLAPRLVAEGAEVTVEA